MRNQLIISAIFLFVFQINFSQDYKLGKVTVDELEEKQHRSDSDAEAAFMINKLNYNINSGFKTYTIKLKIYKNTGFEWANFDIFTSRNGETLKIIDAFTYNIDNGIVTKTKLKKENIFETNVNLNLLKTSIAFPDVKIGSIIEFEYSLHSNGYSFLFEWNFEKKIPVNYSEIYVQIPNALTYNVNFKGFLIPKVINNSYEKKYYMSNIPAYKEEPFVNNIKNYISSVKFELTQTSFRNSYTNNLSTNWEAVVNNIYEAELFGAELNKKNYFEEEINQVLVNKNTRDERIYAIFEFVKNKVKWNEVNSPICKDGVKIAFKNKIGNTAEINLMLTAILRYAGIDANPILISTQSNGILLHPSLAAFNYVISGVEIENDIIFLDATDEFASPNILPKRALNWFGRIIRKSGSSALVDLIPKTSSVSNYNLMLKIADNGDIEGKFRNIKDNHLALFERTNLKNTQESKTIENIENRYDDINITEHKIDNLNDIQKPLITTFSFEKENIVELINDKMFFSPMMFLKYKENPFKSEKREYPVDFSYPYETNYNVLINIPEGYAVESYPEQVKFAMEDMASFTFLVNVAGSRIQLKVVEAIKTPIVSPEYYEALKEYFQKMVDKQNEKIVLKRI